MQNKRDHAKLVMNRFDTYIGAVNTRGAFLLAFNTFLFGGIASNHDKILKCVTDPNGASLLKIVLMTLLFLSLVTTALTMKAVYPFLSSGNSTKDRYHSLIFFKSVAEFTDANEYFDKWNDISDEDAEADIIKQSFHLARGLNKKYTALSWAIRFVYAQVFMMVIALVIISFF
jgi:hypothetical protein